MADLRKPALAADTVITASQPLPPNTQNCNVVVTMLSEDLADPNLIILVTLQGMDDGKWKDIIQWAYPNSPQSSHSFVAERIRLILDPNRPVSSLGAIFTTN